ncbi:MAG: alpha-amylase family glycosyl hydrolase [Zetaproteobacteria bacterium]|nr:alpha-amylase family glycosyl hydrolase [Zetaproteobacteria bacterium]
MRKIYHTVTFWVLGVLAQSGSLHAQLPSASTPWWKSAVFYQIWPRSFQDTSGDGNGDLQGLTQKLAYVKHLGVDAIWLTPIFEAPSYHGYDFEDYYSVDRDYGSMQDLEDFLQLAHQKGLKVIADFVINHISNKHPNFVKSAQMEAGYEDYFVWQSKEAILQHPWKKPWDHKTNWQSVWHRSDVRLQAHKRMYPDAGPDEQRPIYYYGVFGHSQPDLNFKRQKVREDIQKVAKFWLEKGFDGFRLDAVRYIDETIHNGQLQQADTPSTIAYWNEFKSYVKSLNPDAYLVGEAWHLNETLDKYKDSFDAGFDFTFAPALVYSLTSQWIIQDKGGILDKIPKIEGLGNAIAANFASKKQDSYDFYSLFLANHDQIRIANQLKHDKFSLQAAATLLLTLPGPAYLYYGEEIGMTQPNFESPHDFYDDIFKRAPMLWNTGLNAGFSQSHHIWVDDGKWVPWRPHHQPWWHQHLKTQTAYDVESQLHTPDSMLNTYKRLLKLRKQAPEFRDTRKESLSFLPFNGHIVAFSRQSLSGSKSYVLINPKFHSAEVQVEALVNLKPVLNPSQPNIHTASGKIQIPARSVQVWKVIGPNP